MKTKICSIFGLAAFVIAPFAWAGGEDGGEAQQSSIPRPDSDVAEFARGVKFTVDGYQGGAEVQTNFPVLVRLSTAITGFDYGDFYNDGSLDTDGDGQPNLELIDIGFVDAEGNGLSYDIDTWNTNGESLVWVNLPIMTNHTEFAMWYRSSKTGKALNPDNVWTNYVGVWHFREDYGAETGPVSVYDSTTNQLTGTTVYTAGKTGGQRPATVAATTCNGKLGRVRRMGNVNHNSNKGMGGIDVLLGETDSAKRAAVDKLVPNFSGSFWIYGEVTYRYPYYVSRKATDADTGWGIQSRTSAQTTESSIAFWAKSDNSGNDSQKHLDITGLGIGLNTWAKIDFVYTDEGGGGKGYLYKNGTLVKSANLIRGPATNTVKHLYIGGGSGSDVRPFLGLMDEVRLCYSVPTEARVKADFDTVDNSSFLTCSTVVTNQIIERPVVNFTVADIGASHIQFGGTLSSLGSDRANECTFYAKVWPTSGSEPGSWRELGSGLGVGALSGLVKGLTPATAYSYKLKVTNDDGDDGVDSYETADVFTTSGVGVSGTGGDVTRVGDDWIHYFRVALDENDATTNRYVFTPPSYAQTVRALVVAGGGPGGYNAGGGGGAGGLIYNAALGVSGGNAYTITVGEGGVASDDIMVFGGQGGNSSITNATTGANVLTAIGGGAGGNGYRQNVSGPRKGQDGGSGGGSAANAPDGTTKYGVGTQGQGNNGGKGAANGANWFGGGGGGAGSVGNDAVTTSTNVSGAGGGAGLDYDITGAAVFYAGGGGAGSDEFAEHAGSPGAGGSGVGGTGSRKFDGVASAATQGMDGTGSGGGGGCGDDAALYQGGDGGDGIVIIRYASQGEPSSVPGPIISLKSAVCNDLTFKGDVTFRVAWAGYNEQTGKGYETANVKIKWGYSRNKLVHTTEVLAPDVIGFGSCSFGLIADKCTVYCRAVAVNAAGVESESSETLSFYVNENGKATVDNTTPILTDVGISYIDGLYAVVTGNVVSVGMAQDDYSNCVVRVNLGSKASNLEPAEGVSGEFQVGTFSLNITNLNAETTYYYSVEAEGDDGTTVETDPESFTTIGASVLNAATVTSNQRTLTLSGSLDVIGGGVTYILVKWNDGEWEPIEQTFTPTSDTTNFVATFTTPKAWGEATTWAVMCSNAYVTVEGEQTDASAVSTPSSAAGTSGSFTPVDAATYTWKAVDGNWNGNWNDTNHWSSNLVDCVGYPNSKFASASFLNCTTNNPVVVTINGAYEAQFIRCFGQNNASDITFEGTARTSSKLKGRFADYQFNTKMHRSDSRLVFRNMTMECVNDDYEIMRDSLAVSNMTVRLDNVTATGKKYFSLSAPYSRLEFVNATTVTCTKVSIGGTDTVCLIDDSTLKLAQDFWAPADCTENNGLTVQFKGANPQITTGTGNNGVRPHNSPGDIVRFEFAVPIGGYSQPPIQTPGNAKFAYANTNNANTPKYELVVDPDSPALKQASETFTNVLVYAAAGFYTNNMVEAIGTVPTHGEVSCGAFLWGLNDEPLEDGTDISDARQILLDLKGYDKSNGIMFLIY